MTAQHAWFLAKALIWATVAAFFVGGIFIESGLDRLIVGFISGCAFMFVLAFFDKQGKGKFY
jgi:hypothetical protein